MLLCVSNSSVFNEISHFLLFLSWFHFLPALRGAEFIRTRFFFPFSLYSAVHKLLLSHFCAAGTFFSRWLSFSFKLVWAYLPCNKISTCWTEWRAIQHDCNSLKLSGLSCHCLYSTLCVIRKVTACRLASWQPWCLHIHKHLLFILSCFCLHIYTCPCVQRAYRVHTVCVWVYLHGCACATVCLSDWLTDWQKAPRGWRHDNRSPFQCHSA